MCGLVDEVKPELRWRRCNWIRWLRLVTSPSARVNLVGKFLEWDGRTQLVFEVVVDVDERVELCALLASEVVERCIPPVSPDLDALFQGEAVA